MRITLTSVVGPMAIATLLLSGCALIPVGPSPAGEPGPTEDAAAASCPDIEADEFAIGAPTDPIDPVQVAESVGLADILVGTCAYGFSGTEFDGVAFFIIDPSEADATRFLDSAVLTAGDAGFRGNHTAVQGQSETNTGENASGDAFLVAWFAEVISGDGKLPDSSMEAMGLQSGQSVVIGSIELAS